MIFSLFKKLLFLIMLHFRSYDIGIAFLDDRFGINPRYGRAFVPYDMSVG